MDALRPSDPTSVGRYAITARLGTGGMGVVYLGHHEESAVAIKFVHESLSHDREFRARFSREVRALTQVAGPFTARVVEVDTDSLRPWVAMEYVPGPTLEQAVTHIGPLSPARTKDFAIGLAAAIESIHRAGVVHRDLKPSNVILSPVGPKVVDFGVAQALGATTLTATGQRLGTLAWMAPEQLNGEPETFATDMFVWGCLVAFAATGRHPFGDGRPEAVAMRILTAEPDLAGLQSIDTSLAAAAEGALRRDPSQRPTASQVITGVTHVDDEREDVVDVAATLVLPSWQSPATPASPLPELAPITEHTAALVDESSAAAPVDGRVPRPRRRRRAVGVAALVVVLAAAATGVATWPWGPPAGGDTAAPTSAQPSPASPGPRTSPGSTTASPSPASSPSPARPVPIVEVEPGPRTTLADAVQDAEVDSCSGCVDVDERAMTDPAESATRGIVALGVSDPGGGGAMYAYAYPYFGDTWQVLYSTQDVFYFPVELPTEMWVCADGGATNVRAGPGSEFPVVDQVTDVSMVTGTAMRLTQAQIRSDEGLDIQEGEGWYAVEADGIEGWVSSTRVAPLDFVDACESR